MTIQCDVSSRLWRRCRNMGERSNVECTSICCSAVALSVWCFCVGCPVRKCVCVCVDRFGQVFRVSYFVSYIYYFMYIAFFSFGMTIIHIWFHSQIHHRFLTFSCDHVMGLWCEWWFQSFLFQSSILYRIRHSIRDPKFGFRTHQFNALILTFLDQESWINKPPFPQIYAMFLSILDCRAHAILMDFCLQIGCCCFFKINRNYIDRVARSKQEHEPFSFQLF